MKKRLIIGIGFIIVAAILAVAGVLLLRTGQSGKVLLDQAEIVFLEGKVGIIKNGSKEKTRSGSIGDVLYPGDSVQTHAGSFCEIEIPDLGVIKVTENTIFALTRFVAEKRQCDIKLIAGKLFAKVHKISRKERFTLRAGSVVFGVRGTDFALQKKSEEITVAVHQGNVYLARLPEEEEDGGEGFMGFAEKAPGLDNGEELSLNESKTEDFKDLEKLEELKDYIIKNKKPITESMIDEGFYSKPLPPRRTVRTTKDNQGSQNVSYTAREGIILSGDFSHLFPSDGKVYSEYPAGENPVKTYPGTWALENNEAGDASLTVKNETLIVDKGSTADTDYNNTLMSETLMYSETLFLKGGHIYGISYECNGTNDEGGSAVIPMLINGNYNGSPFSNLHDHYTFSMGIPYKEKTRRYISWAYLPDPGEYEARLQFSFWGEDRTLTIEKVHILEIPLKETEENLFVNGDFSLGNLGWGMGLSIEEIKTTARVKDGVLEIDVKDDFGDPQKATYDKVTFDCGVPIQFVKGKEYIFSFDYKMKGPTQLGLMFYALYEDEEEDSGIGIEVMGRISGVEPSTEWKHYEQVFTSGYSMEHTLFRFILGKNKEKIWIDNVLLKATE
jgi:hypothetical protein